MPDPGWAVAAGCRIAHFESLPSTNTTALERARAGERRPLWVVAREQTAGRGRHGRLWRSPVGNLYATRLVVRNDAPARLAELGFVAGLAVHDAATGLLGSAAPVRLALKWPNDLIAGGAKLSGVLVEADAIGDEVAAAVGIGLNLVETEADRATASLASLGAAASPEEAFAMLGPAFEHWFAVWDGGAGFARIRDAWLARAVQPGDATTVRLGAELVEGRFGGIDSDGALLLALASGEIRRISAGEVVVAGEGG